VNICICFTKNWTQYIPVVLHSILSNNSTTKITFYLITNEDHDTLLALIKPLTDYYVTTNVAVLTPFDYSEVNVSPRFTVGTLWRLNIPELPLSPENDRVLYLDADTICTSSLRPLYEQDLTGYYIAGCKDIGIKRAHLAKVKAGLDYVNAGVLLMNTQLLTQDKLALKWREMANSKRYSNHDQDIINITCKGKILHVPNCWNSSTSTGFAPIPRIVHFAGPKNPWVERLPLSHYWFTAKGEYDRLYSKSN